MGKMKLKLSHVMPHSWFYKLKVVNKTGGSHGQNMKMLDSKVPSSSLSCVPKVTYASPINHKAIDIPFPAETPKRSPLAEATRPDDNIAPLDQLDLADYQPSVVLPSTFNIRRISDEIMEAASANNVVFSSGVSFDVRELERRLKTLSSEDRRKYYSSPLLSDVMSSPIMNDAYQRKHNDGGSEESMDVQEYSLDGFGNDGKGKLLMQSAELDIGEDTACADGSCRSIDEHSASSSLDTCIERGSSSMWERDVFSITSEGSEAFTTAPDIDVDSNLMPHGSVARHRFRKLRERMSSTLDNPLYGHAHKDRETSRFCDHHTPSEPIVTRLYEDERSVSYASIRDACDPHEVLDDGRGGPYAIQDDVSGDRNRYMYVPKDARGASYARNEDPHVSDVGIGSTWSVNNEVRMHRDKRSPFNPPPSKDYQRHENMHSLSGKRPLGGFSYAQCKERLLSNREREVVNTTIMEREPEKMSNYAKFKLKKMGMYPDPGLFNTVSKIHTCDVDLIAPRSIVRSRFAPKMLLQNLQSPQPTTSSNSRSPNNDRSSAGHNINNRCAGAEANGYSRSNGTLRAVREKMKDPSFQQFSKASPADCTLAAPESRVFDSFAMVKCSYDPKEDFKHSMVDMIMEKDLHSSHDMVELLQCYLTLNNDVYHDIIVKVFTEVWSELFKHV